MKTLLLILSLSLTPVLAPADEIHSNADLKKDVQRHRAMAAADEAAARCLESGKVGELCEKSCRLLAKDWQSENTAE